MPQSYITDDGIVLIDPGTYVSPRVVSNPGGVPTAGVVTLIGEADEGPDFTKESDLDSNAFGPDEVASVQQKYGSGRLVDAMRAISAAANDPNIVGQVSLVKIVKTNPSTFAEAVITRVGFGDYSLLQARREGLPINLISYLSSAGTAEVEPDTGEFAYVPHYLGSPVTFGVRQNGLALTTPSISAVQTALQFCAAVQSLANGTLATGGATQLPLTGLATDAISCAPVGMSTTTLLVTVAGAFSVDPEVGDTVVIPATGDFGATGDSQIIGAAQANRGAYIVTAVSPGVSSSTVTIQRVNAPSGAPNVASASGNVSASVDDIIVFKNVRVQNFTGQDRQASVGLSGTFSSTISSPDVVLTAPSTWNAQPRVGDHLMVPSTFAGILAGFYEVTASTTTTVSFTRLSNGSAGSSNSTLVGSPITQGTQPFTVYKPVIDGLGKTMELSGTGLGTVAKNPSTLAAVSFVNTLIASASEYVNSLTIAQGTTQQTFTSGGDLVVTVACTQASATMVIGATGIDFKVSSSTIFSAPYSQYRTMSDLVSLINSQTTFRAQLVSPSFGNMSPSKLDKGTYGISAALASPSNPGRIKHDADDFSQTITGLVTNENEQALPSGLPEPTDAAQFLQGGTKAGTTSAQFVAAIDACEDIDTNFLVTCIAQDATADIAEGLTEPTSTYVVDAVNAYANSHAIKMSAVTARKNRIALGGKVGSYTDQKNAAGAISSFRYCMAFQDPILTNSEGLPTQYQPWMNAIIAAGMQAAAGFKGIVKKRANINGIAKPEGDFNPGKPSQRIDALKAGLLVMEKIPTGGFRWVSDQTTYTADNNFVYNSLQAVYIADLMTLTMIQDFDNAVVGKSVAEVSAAGALAFLDQEMFNFLRLKWIAPSDDAPKGYKNAKVQIQGPALVISVEVKLAGLIYFVPISFAISQVTQTAQQ